jgi:hypothetical protein
MARPWQATDGTNWASDSMMEQFGNAATYNVVSGCGYTPNAGNLQVTVASGTITHNGTSTAVAGNTVTLVADGSNPRWTWVAINSSGTAEIVSGTPAADPTEPEVGDRVEVALFKVAAGATVASSQTNMDRRLFAPTSTDVVAGQLGTSRTTTSTTLADISGLSVSVSASTTYCFRAIVHYYAPAANDYKFGITVPSGATLHAMCEYINTSAAGTIGSITSSGGSISANGFGASTPGVIAIWGSLIVSSTAGSLQFQHALDTGTGTNTTLIKSKIELF